MRWFFEGVITDEGGACFHYIEEFGHSFSPLCCVGPSWVFSVVFAIVQRYSHEGMITALLFLFWFNKFVNLDGFLSTVVSTLPFPSFGL